MDNELLDYCRKNKTKVIVFFPLIKPPYLFSLVEQYECDYILQELKPKELLQNQVALPTKIFLPFATGFEIVEFSQIIYVEAADNFSIFITKVGNFRVAKTLKKYEVALQAHDFQRVSRQHLVNLHYIERCNSTILYLWGKSQVELSKSYKEAFLEAMTKIVIFVV